MIKKNLTPPQNQYNTDIQEELDKKSVLVVNYEQDSQNQQTNVSTTLTPAASENTLLYYSIKTLSAGDTSNEVVCESKKLKSSVETYILYRKSTIESKNRSETDTQTLNISILRKALQYRKNLIFKNSKDDLYDLACSSSKDSLEEQNFSKIKQ